MKNSTLAAHKLRLQKVLTYIGTHLDAPLSLDRLAAMACFSPYHFHRVFTGMMGETLQEYVRRLRLERAASQLVSGRVPITTIALEAGYESHSAFTRAFRAAYGIPPSSCRPAFGGIPAPSGVHFEKNGEVKHFRSQKGFPMDVTVKHLPTMHVAYVTHIGPYCDCGRAWDALCGVLGRQGLLSGSPMLFGICYDDPEVTDPAKIRFDACARVDAEYRPADGIRTKILEGGDYAAALHKGPYEEVGRIYAAIYGQWLPRSGYEMCNAPTLEVYLNNPGNTAPADLLTEVYAPVRKLAH